MPRPILNPSPQGQLLHGRKLNKPPADKGKLWMGKGKKKVQQERVKDQETGAGHN